MTGVAGVQEWQQHHLNSDEIKTDYRKIKEQPQAKNKTGTTPSNNVYLFFIINIKLSYIYCLNLKKYIYIHN